MNAISTRKSNYTWELNREHDVLKDKDVTDFGGNSLLTNSRHLVAPASSVDHSGHHSIGMDKSTRCSEMLAKVHGLPFSLDIIILETNLMHDSRQLEMIHHA